MYLALFATAKKIEMMGYRITLVPSLYGTFALLVLIAVVKNMPFASRAGTSNMLQISTELEEAAQVENAGFPRRFFKIVFPLSKGGMISGFMLVFISIMKELDLIVILMTPSQQTLPYMAYAYSAENLIRAVQCSDHRYVCAGILRLLVCKYLYGRGHHQGLFNAGGYER
ncbi:MAG: ABC transporter permease subunit [Enterocloster clostridioformis]